MASKFTELAIDCADPDGLARFWCAVLDYEVRRLLELGARPADVGPGEQSWVVLVDPQGNEFCVLAGRRP